MDKHFRVRLPNSRAVARPMLRHIGGVKSPDKPMIMKTFSTTRQYPEVLMAVAAALAVAVALPVIVVLAFLARMVLLLILVVALLIVAALSLFSPRFRNWIRSLPEDEVTYRGLKLLKDVELAPVHTWIRRDAESVLVGTDDLAPTLLGPVASIELPRIGERFRRGEPFVRLRRGARVIALRAPLSGTVLERNDSLFERPELVNEEPFRGAWLVRLSNDAPREERVWLRHGGRAGAWFKGEVDRVIACLNGQVKPTANPAADQLYRYIDELQWGKLNDAFFAGQAA